MTAMGEGKSAGIMTVSAKVEPRLLRVTINSDGSRELQWRLYIDQLAESAAP
jgi:hypothetical protein